MDVTNEPDRFIKFTTAYLNDTEILKGFFRQDIINGIIQFFKNQTDFDIRNTSVVTAATSDKALVGIQKEYVAAVIDGLCDMQRTLGFASTANEFEALMKSHLTSAYKIASMSVDQLMTETHRANPTSPVSLTDAQAIHHRATTLSTRNQRVLTSLYQAARGTGIAVIDDGVSDKGRLNILGSIGGNTVKNINLEELFGAMDSNPCDDCNSVTSPAAYFVEILQFLRNNNLNPNDEITKRVELDRNKSEHANPLRQTVLERLFARRPDLGDLQLTCSNTNAVLPYIDLANEVMESFVVHLEEQNPGDAKNIGQVKLDVYNCDDTAGELLSEPQHTNFGAYSILSTKLYPFHKLPYNQALDEARTFLNYLGTSRYELLETCDTWAMAKDAAMIAEYLNLTPEEYSALTGTRCGNGGPEMEDEWKYWGYDTESLLLDTVESTHTGLTFIKAQFLPRSGIQFSDLVDLLKTEYINPMANFATRNPIVILQHSDQGMRYRLIRSNGKGLDISDYQRIRQFIHLWHGIGWTIDEIDKAICGLAKPAKITPSLLGQLVAVLKLLKITKLEPSRLLTFWSQISMQGADSLYSRLFLTSGAARADPVLQLDEHGYFFSLATIPQHEPLVMATLGLTKAGLDAIRAPLKNKNDELSIENLSFLFRHGLMAKFLGVTPTVLLEMIEIFGDPFDSPTSCLAFVEDWKRMGDIGFTFAQLHYVVKSVDDPANPLALSEKKIQEIRKLLVEGSAVHPGKDEQGDDHGTTTTVSSMNKLQIMRKLSTDLIVTTVSKALSLSIETTKVLLTGIKIKTKDALMIVISFIHFAMEMQSEPGAMKRAEAAVAVNRTEAGEAAAKKAMGAAEEALKRAEGAAEGAVKRAKVEDEALERGKEDIDEYKMDLRVAMEIRDAAKLAIGHGAVERIRAMNSERDVQRVKGAAEEAAKHAKAVEEAVERGKEFLCATKRELKRAKETMDAAEEALKRAEGEAEEAIKRAEGGAEEAVKEKEAAERAGLPLKSLLTKFARASIFISGFKLSTAEVTCVLANTAGFQGFTEGELSLDGWKTVLAYTELRDSLPKGVDATLLELLQWLSPADRAQAGSAEEKVKKLMNLMLIKKETVKCLTDHFGLPGFNSYPDVAVLTQLKKASDFAKKLSIDAASLLSWASPLADFEQTHRVAQAIRGSIRARYTKEDWGKIVKPLQDQLRKNKRDALIAYLLVQPILVKWGVIDADSLYEFFMIDVQMGPCFETSRIKQAISTVQVFVQRCFSGLEERYGVFNHRLDQKRWEWMKNYRMWEANRKVFLYPENWIEPSLRDDKSPFFLEFEADLVKKDLDSRSMQDAVKNYISRVDEVANLLPVTLLAENGVVHLFARTRSTPYVYYYRSFHSNKTHWKPWEMMEVDIQYHEDHDAIGQGGVFLIPAVIGGRLIVFTPQIVNHAKKAEGNIDKNEPLKTVKYFEIKLGWSEYRNGKWTPKRLSSEAVRWKSTEGIEATVDGTVRTVDLDQPVHRLRFLVVDPTTKETKIMVFLMLSSFQYRIGTFGFQGGCCTVSDNNGWDQKIYEIGWEEVKDDNWNSAGWLRVKNLRKFQFGKRVQDEESLTTSSALWSVIDNPPSLELHTSEELQLHQPRQQQLDHLRLQRTQLLEEIQLRQTRQQQLDHMWEQNSPLLERGLPSPRERVMIQHKKQEVEMIKNKIQEVEMIENKIQEVEQLDNAKLSILLTRASPGLLTHTTASATLDQLYTHLHDNVTISSSNEPESPFSLYDWELGLHLPMLLMDKLASSQQYEKALEIARFVFNPMASSEKDSSLLRVWKWGPFKEILGRASNKDIRKVLCELSANTPNDQVNEWRNHPFQPHVVARGRPVAYMTWMVVRYIKILIAAGDQLFRRPTMESMPLAILYYTMAAHLYGPPIQEITKHTKTTPKTFNTLINQWDAFSNAMVTFENAFPFTNSVGPDEPKNNPGFTMGYFCVPRNPEIRDLRTQIDDRLFKIRHSQDINGVTRKLALWEPPIDPGVFVRAAAAGLSLSSVMNSISGPMPNYRFQYLLRGALELVQELKSLAGAFLSAKEKMDSEAYQRIRAGHESTINGMVLDMKKLSRDEANRAIDSLRDSREGPLGRLNHFLQLIGEKVKTSSEQYNPVQCTIEEPTGDYKITKSEQLETTLSHVAGGLRSGATTLAGISELTQVIPTPEAHTEPMGVGLSVKFGPKNIAKGLRAGSLAMEVAAQINQHLSDSAARTNSFTRQYQDRVLQANSAGYELNSVNAQIKTQEVRVSIVEKDIELQEKQIETAKATEEFLRSKYTNEALYSWQETQLRTLHYQTYIVAYDLAKKVEKSYQFERCLAGTDANFIVGGWDDSRDGLFSGEALGLGLRRLEAAYQESRGHDFEITKHISLRQIAPKALLDLRTTTSCKFSLSEALFDMDFPGHHTRRLKSVSLSLPCVVGPYTSVNCTLRMTSNSYRLGKAAETTLMQPNYVPIQSVAFSSGQNDPGVFELNFHDERYLPFEGAGVISTWDLSLPTFRAFDYNTISDVVMHLRYTSIVGADNEAATKRVNSYLAAGKTSDSTTGDVLYASFDLRNEFASTWQQLHTSQGMALSNLKERLPWWTTNYNITGETIEFRTSSKAKIEFRIDKDEDGNQPVATGTLDDGVTTLTDRTGIQEFGESGTWYLKKTNEGPAPPDLWMLVKYTAVVKPQD